jgi:DNA-binding beta-propeller fold protein YncE
VTRTVGGIVKFPWLAAGMAVPSIGSTVYVLSAFNASTMPVGTPVDLVPVNTATDAVGKAIKVPSSAGESSLAVTPDGAVVYVLRQDARGIAQNVVAVGTATGTTVLLKFAATAMAVAPDGKLAYLLGDMAVMPLATADQSLGKPISTGGFVPVALAISPNGQSVYVAGTPSPGLSAGQPLVDDLFVVNATQARIVKTVALGSYPEMPNWAVAVAPDGKYVYVLGYGDRSASPGVVVTVDAATGAVSKPVHVGPGSDEIAVAPNGGVYVLEAGATPSSGHPSAGGVVPVNTVAGTTAKPIPMPAYAQLLAAPGQTAIWS